MKGNRQGSPSRSINGIFQTFEESLKNGSACRKDLFDKLTTVQRTVVLLYLALSSQNATALAAATFRESTPWYMGIFTV